MIEIPLVPTPKNCDPSVKKAVQILTQKLGLKSTPTFAGLILNGTKPYGIDVSGGTWSSAALNLDANPIIRANGTIIFQSNPSGGYQGRSTESLFLGEGTRNGDAGSWGVFIGYHAGYNNNIDDVTVGVDGTSNIYIGARAGAGEVLLTGTITANNGSDAIVGSGTLFDSELVVGDVIRVKELRGAYEVATITDDTHLTFTTDYTGATGSGLPSYRERGDNYGNECIAIGHLALCLNTTGYENTAIGDNALKMNTTGHGNIALGNDASQGKEDTIITGSYNTSIGTDTLYVVSSGSYNTAIGYKALYDNTTASYNFAAGFQALCNITTGEYNMAIGFEALKKNTTAQYDIAIGHQAGYNDNGDPTVGDNVFIGHQSFYNDNGQYNVGLGYQAGYNNDTTGAGTQGDYNVYIGYKTGYGFSGSNTGYYNVAIGFESLNYNTSGYRNVALGYRALVVNTTGINNFALGSETLRNNQAGSDNVAIGTQALYTANTFGNVAIGNSALRYTTGRDNIGIGQLAANRNIAGTRNTAIGSAAMYFTETGDDNVIIGYQAGFGVSVNSYSDNVFIGSKSGYLIETGSQNIYLGYRSGYNQTTNSDRLIIDNRERADVNTELTNAILYGVMAATPASQTLRINATLTLAGNIVMPNNGTIGQADGPLVAFDNTNDFLEITGCNVGINTTTPAYKLTVKSTGGSTFPIMVVASDGEPIIGLYESSTGDGQFIIYDTDGNLAINMTAKPNVTGWVNNGGKFGIGTTVPVSLLEADGALGLAIETVTGDTTLDTTHSTVLVNASGNVTITLPTAASAYNNTDGIGRIYEIKKIDADADTVTIDGNASETIDGGLTAILTVQYESITIQSDGSNWHII